MAGKFAKPKATTTDRIIGEILQSLREQSAISRYALADLVGVTWQQVAKYEHGKDRLSESRLHLIAQVLNVPMDTFFPDDTDISITATAKLSSDPAISKPLKNSRKPVRKTIQFKKGEAVVQMEPDLWFALERNARKLDMSDRDLLADMADITSLTVKLINAFRKYSLVNNDRISKQKAGQK